jgi:uncharacterized protein YdaT
MSTDKHYYIEQNDHHKYAVRAMNSTRASSLHDTQAKAIAAVKRLNPNDHPNVERVRDTSAGRREQWRSAEH